MGAADLPGRTSGAASSRPRLPGIAHSSLSASSRTAGSPSPSPSPQVPARALTGRLLPPRRAEGDRRACGCALISRGRQRPAVRRGAPGASAAANAATRSYARRAYDGGRAEEALLGRACLERRSRAEPTVRLPIPEACPGFMYVRAVGFARRDRSHGRHGGSRRGRHRRRRRKPRVPPGRVVALDQGLTRHLREEAARGCERPEGRPGPSPSPLIARAWSSPAPRSMRSRGPSRPRAPAGRVRRARLERGICATAFPRGTPSSTPIGPTRFRLRIARACGR